MTELRGAPAAPGRTAERVRTGGHSEVDASAAGRGPRRRTHRHWLLHLTLAVGGIVMAVPYYWQVSTAFKTFGESSQSPPTLWPHHLTFANFPNVFHAMPFGSMLTVSVVMTVGRVVGQLIFCTLAAYAFARLRFRGSGLIFVVFLSVMMVPQELFIIPQYEIMQKIGWLDSIPALIVPRIFNVFGIFLLRQFFATLPDELGEAARIDGANPLRTFWSVYVPLARPGLISLAIFAALGSWQDLLWPLIVNSSPTKMPLASGLSNLTGEFYIDYPLITAASFLAMLPMVLLFLVMQRQFVEGIATTGSKG